MKKIAVQNLADSLGLSRVTVWKVLNNRPGVSPETVHRVKNAVEQIQRADKTDNDSNDEFPFQPEVQNITLLASRTDTSSFWIGIVDQIASELNYRHIKLNYLPLDAMRLSPSDLSSMLQPEKTDGIIIINIYSESIISILQEVNLPKVFFDTIPGHTSLDLQGDLILLEGEYTVKTITESIIRQGRKRVGFIGDIQYAHTNLLRWKGFLEAMNLHGLPVDPLICLTKSIDKDTYRKDIEEFIAGIPEMPDAFVCVSDFVAFITFNTLEKLGYRVPKDVLLTGYDDTKEFLLDHHQVTTVHVNNGLLGAKMVNQVLYRIQNSQSDFEEIKIFPKILYRS